MLKNDYSMDLFLSNLKNNDKLVREEDFQEEIRPMELMKLVLTDDSKIDDERLQAISMTEIEDLYKHLDALDPDMVVGSHPISKIKFIDQAKTNLMNLKSTPTEDDLDFF